MASRPSELSGDVGGWPRASADVLLRVQPGIDTDDAELASLTRRLRARLLDLDVDAVGPVANPVQPEGAKGLEALVGWLGVCLGKEGLRAVIATAVNWATHTGHTIEITYGEDVLKVTGVTSAQQERIINDFLTRHAPGA
jgi:hypothetical protein